MTQPNRLFGYAFAPTLLQRRFGGRAICVLIAGPLMLLAFMPILLQAAKV